MTFTDRLRHSTQGIVDPIASTLARLGVSPDALTVVGMLAHLLYAGLIVAGRLPLAGLLIALTVPLDSLDGAVARKIGRPAGNFGAFLDSTADRLAEIILFGGFILYFMRQGNQWIVIAAYLALAGSLMVSYTRARAEAIGVACKVGILSRVERYIVIVLGLLLSRPDIAMVVLALGTAATVGQRIHCVWQAKRAT
jgi:CDP-diacylglycerol--glycerol-3-phosphate 3-phosphatidyltransferase